MIFVLIPDTRETGDSNVLLWIQAVHVRRSIIFPVTPARRYLMAPILGIVKDVLKTKNIINTEPKIKKETKAEKKINTKTNTS